MGGETRRTSISLPEDLLEKGQKIARMRRRNFSNYIADLIASDSYTAERPLIQEPQKPTEPEPSVSSKT